MIRAAGNQSEQEFLLEELMDPVEIAKGQEVSRRAKLNMEWKVSHWDELPPGHEGKHLVVANQQAHLFDTVDDAVTFARETKPSDPGLLIHYLSGAKGPRIYPLPR